MKHIFKLIVTFGFCAAGVAGASELGTSDEATAMVKSAIAYLKTNGPEKTLAAVNDPKGAFARRDLYVVVHDMNGTILANSAVPKMVGKSIIDIKDSEGKPFMKERLGMLKTTNSGWTDFKWPNSVTRQIETRATYFERSGDLVFTCGVNKS